MSFVISRVSSYTAAIILKGTNFIPKSTSFSNTTSPSFFHSASGIKSIVNIQFAKFDLPPSNKFCVHFYSTKKSSSSSTAVSSKVSRKKKKSGPPPVDSASATATAALSMELEQEKDAFFVVRKGDVIGVYKSFLDCQAQLGSSVSDPPVSVFKGHSLAKESRDYLASRGLQNALYTIRAEDFKDDLFGNLVPCSIQEPSSKGQTSMPDATKKRSQESLGLQTLEIDDSLIDRSSKHAKLDTQIDTQTCVLEFDGASKGNPGPAGAGALLRTTDGHIICKLREGLGSVTNNVAEYRAMLLGLKYALKRGYTTIRVRGDSKLVCSQIQGIWKVRHKDMANLYEQAKQLKDQFAYFQISHVLREFNTEADAQANLAIQLADGEVQEECV